MLWIPPFLDVAVFDSGEGGWIIYIFHLTTHGGSSNDTFWGQVRQQSLTNYQPLSVCTVYETTECICSFIIHTANINHWKSLFAKLYRNYSFILCLDIISLPRFRILLLRVLDQSSLVEQDMDTDLSEKATIPGTTLNIDHNKLITLAFPSCMSILRSTIRVYSIGLANDLD